MIQKQIHIAVLVVHLIIEKMNQTHLVRRQIIEKIIQDKIPHKRVLKFDHRGLLGKIFHRMKTKQNIVVPYTGNANNQQVFNGEDVLKQLQVQEGLLGDQNLIYDVFADDRGFCLIRVRDQTIIKQGGDGSVGIYRVYPTGVVSLQ